MYTKKKNVWVYFAFLVPSLILFIFTMVYPFLSGVHLAFTDWDGISRTYNYVGLKNFINLFRDKSILGSIKNTLIFAILYTSLNNVLALTLAVFLIKKIRVKNVFFHFATRAILTRLHSSKSLRLSTELCILRSGLPRSVNSIITAVCVPESISGSATVTASAANTIRQATLLLWISHSLMATAPSATIFPTAVNRWRKSSPTVCS